MSSPRYYRPSLAPLLWGVVVSGLVAAALFGAHVLTVRQERAAERRAVLAEGQQIVALERAAVAALVRERDSLRVVVARVDTVLLTRIRTVRDTAWIPRDTNPVVRLAACRAQLDTLAITCDAFRRTATTALAKADTIARRDSAVIAGLSRQLVALRRADSLAAIPRPSWRARFHSHLTTAALTAALTLALTR